MHRDVKRYEHVNNVHITTVYCGKFPVLWGPFFVVNLNNNFFKTFCKFKNCLAIYMAIDTLFSGNIFLAQIVFL